MIIRDAREADLPAIVDIFNATIPNRTSTAVLEPVSLDERRGWFHEHTPDRHPLWVAEVDGKIAGYLSFHSFIGRAAYRGAVEVSVYIHERCRHHGIGRTLLERAIVMSPRLEITALIGLILGHNSASLRLFEQLHFERWGFLHVSPGSTASLATLSLSAATSRLSSHPEMLKLESVSKKFRAGNFGVRDVTLELTSGVIGLLGPNGAGKTTLMQMIATVTRPTQRPHHLSRRRRRETA